jgi:flagellar biosynthesis chaperone FliJ
MMKELKQKIKKLEPLIKTRKFELDKQKKILASIRDSKLNALEQLKKYQEEYISGVDALNQERQTKRRSRESVLDLAVSSAKSKWYESIKKVRTFEEQEKQQISVLLQAQLALKSLEKIKENYMGNIQEHIKYSEQKTMDEMAVFRFSGQKGA